MFALIFAFMGAGAQDGQQPNLLMGLMPVVLIILVIYFLMLRPQIKRQKQQQEMIKALQKGDKVMAAGGIVGVIAGIKEKENTVLLKVDDNVKLEIARSSISSVMGKD
ncbi:preprotein translocase subunit YajC [candidate division KSB1 bacterium]